ncbi:uncharacterized protein LOC143354510 [Halictus rubicundus]|uniref:uncharacterized protein LOC143354510 n=1 Tax=Halictus rubicundus TaxID=77578 RepID=UPI0040354401
MPTLRMTFTVLTLLGCQRPPTWTSSTKKFLYKVYSVVVFVFLQVLLLMTILDMIFNVEDQDEFSDNFYSLLPEITSYCKLCSFLTNHKSIMILINSMQRKPYSPVDATEMMIETRFDAINEKLTILFMSMFGSCGVIIWITSLIRDPKNRALAFRAWVPYDYSSPTLYTITYAHQAVSVFIASFMNVAYDTLFSGLMFCIYSQLEILGHRLRNINRDQKESVKQCVRHHNFLFKLVEKVNKDFRVVLCIQFLSSMLIICFLLYRILKRGIGSRMIETFVYAFCMLMQIFYYCWYGNEVRLKSLEIPDFILNSDWVSLDENTKKMLLMIMVRSAFPMQFSSAHIVSMNLDSFMTVLKTSYSAYNITHFARIPSLRLRKNEPTYADGFFRPRIIRIRKKLLPGIDSFIIQRNSSMSSLGKKISNFRGCDLVLEMTVAHVAELINNCRNDILSLSELTYPFEIIAFSNSIPEETRNEAFVFVRIEVPSSQSAKISLERISLKCSSLKMTTTAFRYTFLAFTVLGCLPPATWTSTAKRRLYNVYSFLVLMLVQTAMWTSVLDIVFNVKNQAEFCDNFYITVAMMISIYKMLNFLGKRDNILFLIDKMERQPFTPANEAERIIKMKYDKEIQNNSLAFLFVISLYVLVVWSSSVVRDLKVRNLANPRVWVPYDYSPLALYTMTYCHQASGLITLTFMHYANDTLISGLMILIRGQLTLLQHRLQNIMRDPNLSVKACANHHEDIYQLAADVNKHFHGIMGFQFMASTPMVCLTLFRITTMDVGTQLYECAMYIVCTLMQLSYYCWYGNEVKLKSLEVPEIIFASNWPDLDNSSKKMLMFVMKRATSPIELSSGHIVAVNLDAFMAVLKTSYSVFNVLRTTHICDNTPGNCWTNKVYSGRNG